METQSMVSVFLDQLVHHPVYTIMGAIVMAPMVWAAWYMNRGK